MRTEIGRDGCDSVRQWKRRRQVLDIAEIAATVLEPGDGTPLFALGDDELGTFGTTEHLGIRIHERFSWIEGLGQAHRSYWRVAVKASS
jgi:hypothetical protein